MFFSLARKLEMNIWLLSLLWGGLYSVQFPIDDLIPLYRT